MRAAECLSSVVSGMPGATMRLAREKSLDNLWANFLDGSLQRTMNGRYFPGFLLESVLSVAANLWVTLGKRRRREAGA